MVREPSDWARSRGVVPRWLAREYGGWLNEPAYRAARKLVLVEPFLGGAGAQLPLDYKIYVFGGRAEVVQLHAERGKKHRWTQFDRYWRPLSDDPIDAPPPKTLKAMLGAAEFLAGDRDFLRVDFYEVDDKLWFGEFCLYPGSGLDPFAGDGLDEWLGNSWSRAKSDSLGRKLAD
ncbi:polysaccharide biosynthesis protein [Sphingomonas ginkgonis]|uniref:Polysaccharide biosynthesis protein n=1 Tax=Sphingomonas ginkgonis TaxID=2315330 RepID=A0A429VBQ5_9SPHN|nr:ATP-grasp fold amidoligase family protein [Sphingomonas ginkgonis]RST31297.1 polysaccharide biosynthesis protein [Sphingomonas ginkgonis]